MSTTAPPIRRRNRNWIWVFIALAFLGTLALAVNWIYGASQPLTLQELHAARDLWHHNRQDNYDLKIRRTSMYVSSDGRGGTIVDEMSVQVRNGKVTSFLLNGREPEPLFDRDGKRNVEEERRMRQGYDIDGIFDWIEEFAHTDKQRGIHSFLRAKFDKKDGHIVSFARQIKGKYVPQLLVELKRVD